MEEKNYWISWKAWQGMTPANRKLLLQYSQTMFFRTATQALEKIANEIHEKADREGNRWEVDKGIW